MFNFILIMSEFIWFKDLLRKRIANQHRGRNMIWSVAISSVKKFFDIVDDEFLSWYVKGDILFIKTKHQDLKIKIFKNKNVILDKVNSDLFNLGYTIKIFEIILK